MVLSLLHDQCQPVPGGARRGQGSPCAPGHGRKGQAELSSGSHQPSRRSVQCRHKRERSFLCTLVPPQQEGDKPCCSPVKQEKSRRGTRARCTPVFKFPTQLNKSGHKDLGDSVTALSRHI